MERKRREPKIHGKVSEERVLPNMENANPGFEEVCRKLEDYIGVSNSESVMTLPEIFGKMNDELLTSAWLTYLLDPKRNGFGVAPLRAMLGTDHAIDEDEEIEIEREYTFADGRRIDILISTGEYLIGIEIKTQSGEQPNQTRDYWRSILNKSYAEGKAPVFIFLAPMKPKDEHFTHMSYADLCNAFKAIPYDIRRDGRKNSIFFEFILFLEEVLMKTTDTGFPEKSIEVETYIDHLKTIRTVEKRYDEYAKRFGTWLCTKMEMEGGWITEEPKKDYWVIRQREDWDKRGSGNHFHFELIWTGGIKKINELSKDHVVKLAVHLENANEQVMAWFGAKDRNLIPPERVSVNFQSEESSLQSIKLIAEKLRSGEFHKIAQRINEFLDNEGEG